jgi:hypothetical protein
LFNSQFKKKRRQTGIDQPKAAVEKVGSEDAFGDFVPIPMVLSHEEIVCPKFSELLVQLWGAKRGVGD